jgi:hypothetical protein
MAEMLMHLTILMMSFWPRDQHISYAMLQPEILQDSFLYCENNGSYVFYEAEEATANQTTRYEHRALFIVVP